ncbi:MAG: hypothetical protein K2X32_09680 [Phycisphaerales bacterium]|nr:hypothetical protein [Phycisphaerales bacterium]
MDVPPPDPFGALGLPARFDLSTSEIERAFLARMAHAHPDHAVAHEQGTDIARLATQLNQSRAILSNPEQRAQSLLTRLGGPSKEADRSLPEGFLMEMMETRSTIDAERADAADGSASEALLDRWETWCEDRRSLHLQRVKSLFASIGQPPDSGTLRRIRTELNAWRYIERLLEQLRDGPSL